MEMHGQFNDPNQTGNCCESNDRHHNQEHRRFGHGHQGGSCCCHEGPHHGMKRRFIAPAERQKHLESYIEQLENEIAGAKAVLEKL